MKYIMIAAALALAGCSGHAQDAADTRADIRLDNAFGSHMVLQRGAPVTLRGHGPAGAHIEVGFGAGPAPATVNVTAGDDGRWQAVFEPPSGEAPLTVSLNGQTAAQDVLMGDVFLCSGQSNMEFNVSRANNAGREYDPDDESIRLFKAPKTPKPAPQIEFSGDPQWQLASAETVPDFSAVCYFTAKELQAFTDAPIGLIGASWGGSQIEAWMSIDELAKTGRFGPQLDLLAAYAKDENAGAGLFAQQWEGWWQADNPDAAPVWSAPDAYDWKPLPTALQDWKAWGVDGLENYNGQLWYQTTFDLGDVSGDGALSLASIDEKDAVWINGQFVGGMFGWGEYRTYSVPAPFLKEGQNSLVINVQSAWDRGGLMGPEKDMYLEMGGAAVPLSSWHYMKPERAGLDAPSAPWESIRGYSSLHNGMVAPLRGVRFTGALWYQGESNAGRSETYGAELEALVDGWAETSGADVPTVIIQLPEFGGVAGAPVNSGWANLRDHQRRAAARDDIAYVVTLGAGDMYDIHPPNKQEVARRARDIAGQLFYGQGDASWQREPVSARLENGAVRVTFSAPGRALQSLSADAVSGFELCDNSRCRYAVGQIDGASVTLSVPADMTPERVRYNWADSPMGNLADVSGRPVGSFQMATD